MSRLPRVTGREVVPALGRAGFVVARVTGSHVHLRRDVAPELVTVPVDAGETLAPGLVRSILRQAGLADEEFAGLL